jgi:hypothetical protein
MKYALISQRQMIEIESAFETKRLFATVKDIEVIDKALKILHLLKFSDAVEITGAELAKPEPKLTDAGADTNITRGLEPKGSGMVTLNQVGMRVDLNIATPRKPWLGLTDEEIKEVLGLNETSWSLSGVALQHVMDDARALEAKLKEKNA